MNVNKASKNWQAGYQEALQDIARALHDDGRPGVVGGFANAWEWIINNADTETGRVINDELNIDA